MNECVAKWVIAFGKYRGTTYGDLLATEEGRDYARWMLENSVLRSEKVRSYVSTSLQTMTR